MSRSSSLFVAVAAATTAVLGLVSTPAQAASLSLVDLIESNGTLTVGDKLFSDFSCEVTTSIGFTIPTGPAPAPCSQLVVSGEVENGNVFLNFDGGSAAIGIPSTSALDFLIKYTVTVLDPKQWITAIDLDFNGAVSGTGLANVTETIKDEFGTIIGQLAVFTPNDLQDPPLENGDIQLLNPVKTARVTKDVFLAAGPGGAATISHIGQSFHQTPIPEPGAVVGLLAIGSFGVSQMLKRHKQENKN